ncbi:MAG: hypothetical protein KatS3mg110_2012 [Pirellulaceae bacterium]|nr:MAG: hypothetical protein KatS3mg110_2012 [Pirellulaceae bacterium]
MRRGLSGMAAWVILLGVAAGRAQEVIEVEGQPLAANVERLWETLDFLGHPLPAGTREELRRAVSERDAVAIQRALDPCVLFFVSINPELRVKVRRGNGPTELIQGGYTPVLVKVHNQAQATRRLFISSPQAGPVYRGASLGSLERQQQTELAKGQDSCDPSRFLDVDLYTRPPMTEALSGLEVEYLIALVYSHEAGKREAVIGFDIGQGTQDIGFRGQVPVLFQVRPAIPVEISVRDEDGTPTTAMLVIRDKTGRVYPPQVKRLEPDFFFQPQIYRADGETVWLPPGEFQVSYSRGPEYRLLQTTLQVPATGSCRWELELRRWIDPARFGYYSGDHHIHAAGCAHYESPTQGVTPEAMFRQVKGEGLNVGCVLTWGPCFDYQRRFFSPKAADISEPLTVLKYDLEISGFGSAALGHVCLLNLKNQEYPGSEGTATKGWPSWTVPVLRWAKEQGGVTGYPHSDMYVDPPGYAQWLLTRWDRDQNGLLSASEIPSPLLPAPFDKIDTDEDGMLSPRELTHIAEAASQQLPHLVLPAMRGAGAMEIFVSAAEGVCDIISAMDTGRIGEWNTWYHLMNVGLPVVLSGETDFPCMSSRRVGQGRVYVKLADGPVPRIDFGSWCEGLRAGRSYVSDGFAHAVLFTVNGQEPGRDDVRLDEPGTVTVQARVAFSPETPAAVAHGTVPIDDLRAVGDTRVLHGPRREELVPGGRRRVELVVNGQVVRFAEVPADGRLHDLAFQVPIHQSSWVALRQFPQLHTNPVRVLVAGKPVRASRASALWCAEAVRLLWENRSRFIREEERAAARAAYERAIAFYEQRAEEAP